jgi:hypothetical protein
MFSSYWCTAIFAKSRSLHYVLKKQRNSISNDDTEEGTTLSEETTLGILIIRKKQRMTL